MEITETYGYDETLKSMIFAKYEVIAFTVSHNVLKTGYMTDVKKSNIKNNFKINH